MEKYRLEELSSQTIMKIKQKIITLGRNNRTSKVQTA